MSLRVTRPGFIVGIRELKASQGVKDYDVNKQASQQEMRAFVCGQCHVEYYFKGADKQLTYPWSKGLKVDDIQAYYDEAGFKDWVHKQTGAPALKAQHPEFEMWNQGIHGRSGVTCVDCHMPEIKYEGQTITDHQVNSPLLKIEASCTKCHKTLRAGGAEGARRGRAGPLLQAAERRDGRAHGRSSPTSRRRRRPARATPSSRPRATSSAARSSTSTSSRRRTRPASTRRRRRSGSSATRSTTRGRGSSSLRDPSSSRT